MARPSKFTPETIKRLTDAIRMGSTYLELFEDQKHAY